MDSKDVKRIPLPNKKFVTVDSEDFDKFSGYRWYQHSSGYVFRWRRKGDKSKTKAIYLHKEVLPAPKNMTVKFRVDNKLNVCKSNLFHCTKSQLSHYNSKKDSSSKYSGVFWDSGKEKWISTITYKGTLKYVGSFHEETDAALAYDFYSRKFYGAMAKLNFPGKQLTEDELRVMLQKGNKHTSKYRGVSFHPKVGLWRARITYKGKRIDLKLHETEEQAARAYDKEALKLFGKGTYLNFP